MFPRHGAHYRCTSCGWEFVGYAGPEQNEARLRGASNSPSEPTGCLRCGSLYMKWTNYAEMFGRSAA